MSSPVSEKSKLRLELGHIVWVIHTMIIVEIVLSLYFDVNNEFRKLKECFSWTDIGSVWTPLLMFKKISPMAPDAKKLFEILVSR